MFVQMTKSSQAISQVKNLTRNNLVDRLSPLKNVNKKKLICIKNLDSCWQINFVVSVKYRYEKSEIINY